MDQDRWTNIPPQSDEAVESETVGYIHNIVEWMRCQDHDRATWRVGTTLDPGQRLAWLEGAQVSLEICGWCTGSAKRAAEELAEYHGMELEGTPEERHHCIFAYTDREPTREELRQRNKEPLSLKQKAVFRAIRDHIAEHGGGPTKTELMQIMGHRSLSTTNDYLAILATKNWILPLSAGLPIELN